MLSHKWKINFQIKISCIKIFDVPLTLSYPKNFKNLLNVHPLLVVNTRHIIAPRLPYCSQTYNINCEISSYPIFSFHSHMLLRTRHKNSTSRAFFSLSQLPVPAHNVRKWKLQRANVFHLFFVFLANKKARNVC